MEIPIQEIQTERIDYRIILTLVERKSRVLDMGCGDGELLYLLNKNWRHVRRVSKSTPTRLCSASNGASMCC